MTQKRKRWLAVIATIVLVLAVDIISKQLILDSMIYGETLEPVAALVPYFQITLSSNTGAAFGMLPQAGNLFLIFAFIAVIVMLRYFDQIPENAGMTRIATGLIVGGALGNAIDRIQHGHVVDFIHYQLPQLDLSNVSNLADHAIVLGVILVLLDSWRLERLEQQQKALAQTEQAETPNLSEDAENKTGV